MKNKLTNYEKKIEASVEKWIEASKSELKELQKNAKNSLAAKKKAARISFRMSLADLNMLKKEANHAGLGYQTFMSSILHRYVTGQLIDQKTFLKTYKTLVDSDSFLNTF